MNTTVIVDYRAGNLTSVNLALASLHEPAIVTDDPKTVAIAPRIIFPGVGAAGSAMQRLREHGLDEALRQAFQAGTPILGICLGTQIILERSEEDGGVDTMGLVPGSVVRFQPESTRVKVPHMGWNRVRFLQQHPLFDGLADQSEFYFVHSYYPCVQAPGCALADTEYAGIRFASVLNLNNLLATQFHPEKSGRIGLKLLQNFCNWNP